MWHKSGAVLVTAKGGALRVAEQDWSSLVVEAFPSAHPSVEHREVYGPEGSPDADRSTTITLATDGQGRVSVSVSASAVPKAWTVRLHLRPGQHLELVADGKASAVVRHLRPTAACSDSFFPFGGPGSLPACNAGPVAEFDLEPAAGHRRTIQGRLA